MKNKIIKLSKSSISDEEKKAVLRVLDNEYLGMGPEVKNFESDLSKYFNREAICVSSGTAALHLALQACNIKMGDEVLVPSFTYLATFQAISATGAIPISVDIDKDLMLIDINDCKNKITKKRKAIIPVHYASNPCDMSKLLHIKEEYNIRIIEDAAHAFGSFYKGNKIGSFGDITCFSFDGIKNITSGEGGAITSDDKELLQKIKDARLLGVINDTEKRYKKTRSWSYDVVSQGWRYHMSDIMASIGRVQLKKFPVVSKKRKKIANIYIKQLKKNKNIKLIHKQIDQIVPHIFPVIILKKININILRTKLLSFGIETGIHYFPNHELSYYKTPENNTLNNTNIIKDKILSLPLHVDLLDDELFYICDTLDNILNDNK